MYLVRFEASEAEHADLVGDVLPVARRSLPLETFAQFASHRDNTVSHRLDVAKPRSSSTVAQSTNCSQEIR